MTQKKRIHSFLARWWFTAKMASHGILSNPLRSALTILGVAIGVASVVCLMGIGEGARQAVIEQFESLGANVISINIHKPEYEFNEEDVDDLVERVQGMDIASPVVNTKAEMRWKRAKGSMKLIGVNEKYRDKRPQNIDRAIFHKMACKTEIKRSDIRI
ncbi:ABC transporter permease [Clostridiaceae bacterium M8S5]|nr:ABC transporter permease [Clostridiaceae bacterium M8S5]